MSSSPRASIALCCGQSITGYISSLRGATFVTVSISAFSRDPQTSQTFSSITNVTALLSDVFKRFARLFDAELGDFFGVEAGGDEALFLRFDALAARAGRLFRALAPILMKLYFLARSGHGNAPLCVIYAGFGLPYSITGPVIY